MTMEDKKARNDRNSARDYEIKVKYIVAALGISLMLCVGATLLFWLAERSSEVDSGQALNRIERIESSVYHG